MTCAVSAAVREGAEAVICASTGNTAASAAAYAARAGLTGAVIVPEGKIATGKLAQALMHGARVIALRGNFDQALQLVRVARRAPSDRARQLRQPVPARGAEDGGLRDRGGARGDRRALHPRRQRGQHHRVLDRLHRGAAPGRACWAGRPRAPRRSCTARPWSRPRRWRAPSASAIPPAGRRRWARWPPPTARSAPSRDAQILDAYRFLAAAEGVFCEPASAAGVAGLLAHGAGRGAPRRVRAHRPRAQGPADGARAGRLGGAVRARPRRGRARRAGVSALGLGVRFANIATRLSHGGAAASSACRPPRRTWARLRRAGLRAGAARRGGGGGDGALRGGDRPGHRARPAQPVRARLRHAPSAADFTFRIASAVPLSGRAGDERGGDRGGPRGADALAGGGGARAPRPARAAPPRAARGTSGQRGRRPAGRLRAVRRRPGGAPRRAGRARGGARGAAPGGADARGTGGAARRGADGRRGVQREPRRPAAARPAARGPRPRRARPRRPPPPAPPGAPLPALGRAARAARGRSARSAPRSRARGRPCSCGARRTPPPASSPRLEAEAEGWADVRAVGFEPRGAAVVASAP